MAFQTVESVSEKTLALQEKVLMRDYDYIQQRKYTPIKTTLKLTIVTFP